MLYICRMKETMKRQIKTLKMKCDESYLLLYYLRCTFRDV